MTYSGDLYHSKGEWKIHKYLKKIGKKYIYPINRTVKRAATKAKNFVKKYFDIALGALTQSAVRFGFGILNNVLNYNMNLYDANGQLIGNKTIGDMLISEISAGAVNYVKTNDEFRDKLLTSVAKEGVNTVVNDPKIRNELMGKVASESANAVQGHKDDIVNAVVNAASSIKPSDIQNAANQGWQYVQNYMKKKKR